MWITPIIIAGHGSLSALGCFSRTRLDIIVLLWVGYRRAKVELGCGLFQQEAIEIKVWNWDFKPGVVELFGRGMETSGAWNL